MEQSTDLQLAWEFVSEHYPNYSTSQTIAESDLLQRVVDLEYDPDDEEDSANKCYKEIAVYLSSNDEKKILAEAKIRLNACHDEIYKTAIAEFMKVKK